jgi:hypothetical protein
VDGSAQSTANPATSKPRGSNWNKANPSLTARPVAGIFFPQRPILRLNNHGYSPSVHQIIVTAAARLSSFSDAAFALSLCDVTISPRHVQTLTQEIGDEMIQAREAQVEAYRHRVLEPRMTMVPEVVVVEVDGGRLRTRAEGCGPGVHQAEGKEDKVACFATLTQVACAEDPCPEPPPSFVEPRRIQRLVAQMKGSVGETKPQENVGETSSDSNTSSSSDTDASSATPESEPWSPRRLVRSCVASVCDSRSFGPMMAAEAQSRNFYQAKRRAFVADGAAYNWTIHRGYFRDFEPIVDLLHVICYLFNAAYAIGATATEGWSRYERWLRSVWQGRVQEVIEELSVHQKRLGTPSRGEELSVKDPRRVVHEAWTYLRNNASRMDYPRYRREGLPTTSSLAESLVGEVNARVKGRSKFWNRPSGAEGILQVRAALLSEDGRLERFFANRPGSAYRRRKSASQSRA